MPKATEATGATPERPQLRLDGKAYRPLRCALELSLVPDQDDFSGVVAIDIQVDQATSEIWLNATKLDIRSATVKTGEKSVAAQARSIDEDFVVLSTERPVGPGSATIRLEYQGKFSTRDSKGLFRQKEGGLWYVISQFEPTYARRAFPSMDQPNFKVPWTLTLKVPKDLVAVSNTPIDSETEVGGGLKSVRFKETKPLPSYLVALAVGPYDIVQAGTTKSQRVPIRLLVPRGRAKDARLAAEITPQIVGLLEDYFRIPYPYEKLDSVAVPETIGFGAMENAGMVTYNQSLLLARPNQETTAQIRRYASVCAHELGHQWFGDLVTLAWWDDTWLNEAFATWITTKVLDRWRPAWDYSVDRAGIRSTAAAADRLLTARRVRQPIQSSHDIRNAFDDITYRKGAAVLSMVEHWIGEETFARGVREYLRRYAYANATSEDFIRAIGEVAGTDPAPIFNSFLDQPGIPLITAEISCPKGRPPVLTLQQKRYLPIGSGESPPQLWNVPVCFRYGTVAKVEHRCEVLRQERQIYELPSTFCPTIFFANDRATGYYRVQYSPNKKLRDAIRPALKLSAAERVATFSDALALVGSNAFSAAEVLEAIPEFLRDGDLHVAQTTAEFLQDLSDRMITPEVRAGYQRYVRKYYGPLAHRLGWLPKPSDSHTARVVRPTLAAVLADAGHDGRLLNEARKFAGRWIQSPNDTPEENIDAALLVAAENGDRALFERLVQRAEMEPDRRVRRLVLTGVSHFRDPELVRKSLALVLADKFRVSEAFLLLETVQSPGIPELLYQFIREHIDELVTTLPSDFAVRLPSFPVALCDASKRPELSMLFQGKTTQLTGGPRQLAQAMERLSLCSAYVDAQRPNVVEFFKKQSPVAAGASR